LKKLNRLLNVDRQSAIIVNPFEAGFIDDDDDDSLDGNDP